MGQGLPVDWAELAAELGTDHPFFRLSAGNPKVIYTTNAIESINMSLRKVIKTRSSFPTDEAVTSCFTWRLRTSAKMDNANKGLESRSEPLHHPV